MPPLQDLSITSRLANVLNPMGRVGVIIVLIAFLALAVFAAGGMGFRFDPFGLTEKRAERAEAAAAVSRSDAIARTFEADGARDTVAAVERTLTTARAADAVAIQHHQLAKEAPDASQPLDPDRVVRLRNADHCLCALSPGQCPGYAAPPGDARNGDPALCVAPAS